MEIDKQKYGEYVKEITPVHNLPKSMACAFLVGGVICVIGQFITNFLMNRMGMEQEPAAIWNLLALIFLSIVLTGLNIYPKIVKFGGAGALVPITGFANSVWRGLQDIYNCRTGDLIWGPYQLGIGTDLLGWRMDGDFPAITIDMAVETRQWDGVRLVVLFFCLYAA